MNGYNELIVSPNRECGRLYFQKNITESCSDKTGQCLYYFIIQRTNYVVEY